MNLFIKIIFFTLLSTAIFSQELSDRNVTIDRSKCCSRHGGVDGCSPNGKAICKDGTISISCSCRC